MDTAILGGGSALEAQLPIGVRRLREAGELVERRWELLALTADGCRLLRARPDVRCGCGTLLLPGDWGEVLEQVRTERAVSYGLSPRDTLTLSSLGRRAVVCVQRTLLRPDGVSVEMQELPVERDGLPPELLLVLAGLRLLGG